MTWGPCLHEEIVRLFWEAQHPQRIRVSAWLERRYRHRLAKRRESYDAHRYFRDAWYLTQLEIQRAKSRKRAAERHPVYVSQQEKKASANAAARLTRVAGRTCPECGQPLTVGKGTGTTPKYCSMVCNRRASGRAYWRRNRDRLNAEYRERCRANPEKERARKREWWRKKYGRCQ
jgi:hypothetical protein